MRALVVVLVLVVVVVVVLVPVVLVMAEHSPRTNVPKGNEGK